MSGRVLYECTSCVAVILSQVAQSLRVSAVSSNLETTSTPVAANTTIQQILDHVKSSGVLNCLCLCLESSGLSLISGSTNLLRSACESCRGIWSIIDAFELLSAKGNTLFPLNSFRSHSLIRLDIKDCDEAPSYATDLGEAIDTIIKAFLKSKAIQVALYFCLHQRHEIGLSAGMQVSILLLHTTCTIYPCFSGIGGLSSYFGCCDFNSSATCFMLPCIELGTFLLYMKIIG